MPDCCSVLPLLFYLIPLATTSTSTTSQRYVSDYKLTQCNVIESHVHAKIAALPWHLSVWVLNIAWACRTTLKIEKIPGPIEQSVARQTADPGVASSILTCYHTCLWRKLERKTAFIVVEHQLFKNLLKMNNGSESKWYNFEIDTLIPRHCYLYKFMCIDWK